MLIISCNIGTIRHYKYYLTKTIWHLRVRIGNKYVVVVIATAEYNQVEGIDDCSCIELN
jgi:hypothetical protein